MASDGRQANHRLHLGLDTVAYKRTSYPQAVDDVCAYNVSFRFGGYVNEDSWNYHVRCRPRVSYVQADGRQINQHVSQDQKDVNLAFSGSGLCVAVWESQGLLGDSNRQVCAPFVDTEGRPGGKAINGLVQLSYDLRNEDSYLAKG